MAVPVNASLGASFEYGKATVLFPDDFATRGPASMYDVTADGQRFVVFRDLNAATDTRHGVLVLNWFEELKARFAPRR